MKTATNPTANYYTESDRAEMARASYHHWTKGTVLEMALLSPELRAKVASEPTEDPFAGWREG